MIPVSVARHCRVAALGLILGLAACGGTPPTATPATPPAAPTAAAPAAAAGSSVTASRAVAPAVGTAASPATATAARMTPPAASTATATTTATARSRATTGTATAAAAVPTTAPTVAPAATPRGYAPGDPCAPYAAGAVPPSGRAVPAAPTLLCIPTLALSAPVVPVGATAAGTMAEPPDPRGVAWYSPGVMPGAVGNAAIAGTVAAPGVGPAIFWDLNKIIVGDLVVVVDEAGVARRFKVSETEVYLREAAPLLRVFGPAPDANLTLITGAGTWQPTLGAYDSNLLVFARLQP